VIRFVLLAGAVLRMMPNGGVVMEEFRGALIQSGQRLIRAFLRSGEGADSIEDGGGGFRGGAAGGIDGEAGEAAVERVAEVEAGACGLGIAEVGAVDVAGGGDRDGGVEGLKHAAVEEGGEGGVEEDGEGAGGLFEQEAIGEGFGGATAEGEDELRLSEGAGEGGGLEAAEVGFAVALKELGDGGAGASFEVGVEIQEGPADLCGEEPADGGFAGAHEPGENDAADGCGDGGVGRLCARVGGGLE